jgi:hypothetical protein
VGTKSDIDGLIRFIGGDDAWRARLTDVMDEHLLPAMEEFDVDFEDLGDILGASWPTVLWGCAFEDFLGRTYGPDRRNIVDLYLKRHGWRETALNRAYIEGLRDAPVSLYEVSGIKPGESMVLSDRLTDAEPVTVREKSATRQLRPWDHIAVRVVPQGDHHVISGALLPFSPEATDLLTDVFRETLNLGKRKTLRLSADQLRQCAPLFANAWLFDCLPRALDPEPAQFANTDGDELVFHDVRFPLAPGVVQKDVVARLEQAPAFEAAGPKVWNWLAADEAPANRPKNGLVLGRTISGFMVLGMLELKGKALTLSVNSAARAERGAGLIRRALGDLLKPPLTAIRTVEQMMSDQDLDTDLREEDEIPPEVARQIVHDHMDQHYRDTLDQPIPSLDGKTPRQAVRSPAGRKKVVEWLKLVENKSASRPGSPLAEYDFGWMWEALGVAAERR